MKKLNRIGAWLMVCVLLITMIMPADVNAATKVAKPKLQSSKMQTDGSVLVKFVPKSGVSIYYTTNGKKPAPGKSGTKKYSKKGIRLTSTKTIKAVEKKGSQVSAVYSKKFKALKPLDPPKIVKGYVGLSDIPVAKIKITQEAEIYYTLNGTDPKKGTTDTYFYNDKIYIPLYEEETVVKAIAVNGKRVSSVASRTIELTEDEAHQSKRERDAKAKVKEIVSNLIRTEMDDYTKIQVLHDYVVDTVTYDLGDPTTIESDDRGTAAGALLDGLANCTGYSDAFEWLCEDAGIETKGVSSPEMSHGWSLVKYNGYWYHVDPTWDDHTGKYKYSYFLLNDGEMAKDHTWDQSKYPACNGPHVPKPYEK